MNEEIYVGQLIVFPKLMTGATSDFASGLCQDRRLNSNNNSSFLHEYVRNWKPNEACVVIESVLNRYAAYNDFDVRALFVDGIFWFRTSFNFFIS
jgi:hypothetical protein